MQSNRLGCLTGTGIIAALITIFVITGYAFTSGNSMFSPGALSAYSDNEILGGVASHAEIGKDCKACHTAPWESENMADRCAVCHAEIASDLQSAASMHGKMSHDNPNLSCRHCHPEHRGTDAQLTVMDSALFPHEAVGYSLNGHQFTAGNEPFICDDCHHGDISTFASDSCQTCHSQIDLAFTQAHLLAFGADCLACHDGVDRYGDDFNHNKFAFQLTGKHANVICTQCHLDARTIVDLQALPQDCDFCHRGDEPHEGRFGIDCAACHTADGWTPAKFDHNLSVFKLEGEHAEVRCEQCHQNNVYKGTPTDCFSCHQGDDEHDGKFGTDCAACHNPSDWDDATFDHNLSKFPLTGAHVNVNCENCHTNDQFQGLSTACVTCHADPAYHAGLFGTDCAACHSTTAWSPAQFNGPHAFPLNHGDGASCATCHPAGFTAYTCYGCHEHNEAEVRSEHSEEGINNFQNCMECHPDGREHEGGEDN